MLLKRVPWGHAILILGLLFRVALFFVFHNNAEFTMDDDSGGYLTLAENIRLGNGFSLAVVPPYAPNTFRTPGYPIFLAFHRMITGTYQTALVTQSVLVVISAWIIARIGLLLGHRRAGLWAVGMFLFMPFSIMVSLRYLTQPLFAFLLMLALWWWLLFITTQRTRFLYGTAILLPFIALVRPIAIWLPVPFLLGLLAAWWRMGTLSVRTWLRTAVVTITAFMIIVAPWCYRNYTQIGDYTLSSLRAFQFYYYDLPPVLALVRHTSYDQARAFLEKEIRPYLVSKPDEYASAAILSEHSIRYIKKYPEAALLSRFPLLMNFFVRDGIRYWFEYWEGDALNKKSTPFLIAVVLERIVLALFTCAAAVTLIKFLRRKNSALWGVIMLVIAYFALLSGGVSSAGFRFPVEGLILLAGAAILFPEGKRAVFFLFLMR